MAIEGMSSFRKTSWSCWHFNQKLLSPRCPWWRWTAITTGSWWWHLSTSFCTTSSPATAPISTVSLGKQTREGARGFLAAVARLAALFVGCPKAGAAWQLQRLQLLLLDTGWLCRAGNALPDFSTLGSCAAFVRFPLL